MAEETSAPAEPLPAYRASMAMRSGPTVHPTGPDHARSRVERAGAHRHMSDVTIDGVRGAADLAEIGGVLGRAGIGLEGGGMWQGVAHYLVADGDGARDALLRAGWSSVTVRDAVVVDLDADVPGALGRLMTRLAAAGVDLIAQYSDHDNRKVLVVDEPSAVRSALA